jgi:N utilization substance protein B
MTRRHKARELLVQSLYASQIGGQTLREAVADQIERRKPSPESLQFIEERVAVLERELATFDAAIDASLTGWAPERVSAVERCILRLALSELQGPSDVPPAAVLDEAIELAKDFSGPEAARFVNGVLDRLGGRGRASGSD